MASPVLPAPNGDLTEIAPTAVETEAPYALETQVIDRAPDHDPGSPRAPPLIN